MANTLYTTMKQYILRRLGSPVINIEITDDQLEDVIDEAVKEFVENHADGVNIGFYPLSITEGVTTYQLDENIQAVLDVMTISNIALDVDDPLLIKTFYLGNSYYDMYRPNLVDVEIFRQYFAMYQDSFKIPLQYDFNSTTNKLILHAEPLMTQAAFLKVYQSEDDIKKILTNMWIKKYAVELARRQWGTNLMKYTSVSLPGGAQFNYDGILAKADAEIEKLMEELEDRFGIPLDPEVG